MTPLELLAREAMPSMDREEKPTGERKPPDDTKGTRARGGATGWTDRFHGSGGKPYARVARYAGVACHARAWSRRSRVLDRSAPAIGAFARRSRADSPPRVDLDHAAPSST